MQPETWFYGYRYTVECQNHKTPAINPLAQPTKQILFQNTLHTVLFIEYLTCKW